MRIILVTIVLIGGALIFGFWSLGQFNQALDDVESFSMASVRSAYQVLSDTNQKLASITEKLSDTSTSTDDGSATSTPAVPELAFTFPTEGSELFVGCTYDISWEPSASTTVDSLEVKLIDVDAEKVVESSSSGLKLEHSSEEGDLESVSWKVGFIWPGDYRIKVSKVNDIDIETDSDIFTIKIMPKNIEAEEKESICKDTGAII